MSTQTPFAVAENTALVGVRPWPIPGALQDLAALNAAVPDGRHGAIVAYGERDQVGKIGASLAVLVRGPLGVTFVGRLEHKWNEPLRESITIAKVF